MLFSKDLLFIHVPKTGGMSVTECLLDILPPPVYYSHPEHDSALEGRGIVQLAGTRHETLEEAAMIVRRWGFDLDTFPRILAVIRNPYSLEVSRYAYLQAGHPWDRGENQRLAMRCDFETFARCSTHHSGPKRPIESYFLVNGRLPANVTLLRFENLHDEVTRLASSLGLPPPENFPWKNRSIHHDFRAYYTAEAERAVRQRYRWLFDNGYYPPMDITETDEMAYRSRREIPLSGPVVQYGPLSGYWPDGWAGDWFRFTVLPTAPVTAMEISGLSPNAWGPSARLTANIADARFETTVEAGKSFCWRLDVAHGLAPLHVVVHSSESWCPANAGQSPDRRRLAFKLREISFEAASK